MTTKPVVTKDQIEEIRALVASGDLDLAERRSVFKATEGRETTLSDDELLAAYAATEDDDDDVFIDNVKLFEQDPALAAV